MKKQKQILDKICCLVFVFLNKWNSIWFLYDHSLSENNKNGLFLDMRVPKTISAGMIRKNNSHLCGLSSCFPCQKFIIPLFTNFETQTCDLCRLFNLLNNSASIFYNKRVELICSIMCRPFYRTVERTKTISFDIE